MPRWSTNGAAHRGQRSPAVGDAEVDELRAGEVAAALTPLTCVSALLAPVTASVMPASAWSASSRTLPQRPIGPAKPTGAPVTRSTTSSGASSTPGVPSASLSFGSESAWSPRTKATTTVIAGDVEQRLDEALGRELQERRHLLDRAPSGRRDLVERGRRIPPDGGAPAPIPAFSTLAAYSQASQLTIASSPESASTWNSCERLPPMAPVSASTGRYASPQRSKMRR
mgnify:CR=1 FL=1